LLLRFKFHLSAIIGWDEYDNRRVASGVFNMIQDQHFSFIIICTIQSPFLHDKLLFDEWQNHIKIKIKNKIQL
jgi:hypothetical protein